MPLRVAFRGAAVHAILVSFCPAGPEGNIRCLLRPEEETPERVSPLGQAALGKIFQLSLSLAALGVKAQDPLEFQVAVWEDNFPRETLPLVGWLPVPAPPEVLFPSN